MALSGSVSTTDYQGRYLTCSWSATQSIANNTSTISWTLKGAGTGQSTWYNAGPIWIGFENTNGTNIYSNTYWSSRQKLYDGTVVASGSFTVTHNNDGTRQFRIFIEGAIYNNSYNVSGNGTVTLNTIPRYANAVPTLTARTETTLSISWTADGIVDQFQYSIDDGATYSTATNPNASSGSFTVTGLTANTLYKVKLKARRKDSQLTNESDAVNMRTYSYPYGSTLPDFTIGQSVTLGIFNPLSHEVSVVVKASNSTTVATGTTSGTSIVLTPTSADLYASIPNALNANYSVSVTYDGHTNTNTGGLYKVDENASKPTIGAFTYADSNGTATAITLDSSKIVQNISTPLFTGSSLAAQNSATLATASVTVNGSTYTNNSPGATTTIQGGVINSTSNVTATLTLTDSRGISNTKTVEVAMIAWSAPTGIIEVARQSNFYTETDMKVDADYTQIGNSTVTISVLGQAVPITGQTTPADVTATLTDNVQSTVNFANTHAWNIAVTITDSFGGSTTYSTYISRGIPFVFFDRFNDSMSLNKFPTHQNSLEVNGDIYADNVDAATDYKLNGSSIFPVSISNGGTGASTAAGGRENLGALGFPDQSNVIATGTLNGVSDTTYTATADCVFYLLWAAQANSNLVMVIYLNSVKILDYSSGAAVNNTVSLVPFFLKSGDKLRINQSNNKTCPYFVLGMR